MTTQDSAADALDEFSEMLRDEQVIPDRRARATDPEERRRRRRRRRRGLIAAAVVVTVVAAGAGGYVGWALTAPVDDPVAISRVPAVPTPAPVALAVPTDGVVALSVSGADDYLGPEAAGIWLATGADEPVPMASITKLITALAVLDAHPLTTVADAGPTLTFDREDHRLYDKYYVMGATIAAMPIGSSMSQRDALATMLIPSASNYAEAVAGWAFGSQGAFVSAANRWLEANGLTRTTVVEPTGIDSRNTSTPGDLIGLGRLAAAHPVIAEITATRTLVLPGSGELYNTNTLLGTAGVTGLKTGTLAESGSNLLYTATLDVGAAAPLEIVGVTLGGQGREGVNRAVTRLLDSIVNGFREVPLAERGQGIGSYSTAWGSTAQMVLSEDASLFTWSDTPIVAELETWDPATWTDGEVVGSVTWTAGTHTVTVPVEIDGTIVAPTDEWRLTHPGELG